MKRLFLAAWLLTMCFISYAQKEAVRTPYPIPVDSITKLITYEGVIEVKNEPAVTLYKRINEWFHTYYKNPTEVIRENDSVKFSIVGKPRFRITNLPSTDGGKTEGGVVQYTITVTARDGRFRYEMTAFNSKQVSYYPCENWLDTKSKSYAPVYNDYLEQVDKTSIEVINSLKNAVMREKQVKDKDNW
jgi:hypothetical protein